MWNASIMCNWDIHICVLVCALVWFGMPCPLFRFKCLGALHRGRLSDRVLMWRI